MSEKTKAREQTASQPGPAEVGRDELTKAVGGFDDDPCVTEGIRWNDELDPGAGVLGKVKPRPANIRNWLI